MAVLQTASYGRAMGVMHSVTPSLFKYLFSRRFGASSVAPRRANFSSPGPCNKWSMSQASNGIST